MNRGLLIACAVLAGLLAGLAVGTATIVYTPSVPLRVEDDTPALRGMERVLQGREGGKVGRV